METEAAVLDSAGPVAGAESAEEEWVQLTLQPNGEGGIQQQHRYVVRGLTIRGVGVMGDTEPTNSQG